MGVVLRLVLARHGQTPANVAKTLDTLLPGPGLTDLGRLQAEALGKELAADPSGPVTALVSSPARRARETAGLVAPALGLTPGVVDGTHEVQVGELEGHNDEASIERFRATYDAWREGDVTARMPGGESGQDVLDRYLPALEGLRAEHRDGTVVLVSHGAVLRLVAHALVGEIPDLGSDDHVDNCGRVVLRAVPDAGWSLEAWRREAPGGLASNRDATGG
ncbi:histidine phosphatase family protein [Actinomycetospora endophytica]|uniref:Histidine phosphatase family protein n=1 Tax=Actinomycetospora endophytica TaxID=2291215 RepID=A0ABS8P4V4_9PSEU|nr:histidine phosphatase family protein [Actinomycetospora endophytica]MCD2193285.1 histidine phosphatase family protein [Actinomycetospora endophytica]